MPIRGRPRTTSARRSAATSAAAPAISRSSTRLRLRPSASQRLTVASPTSPYCFRYIGAKRRTKEAPRFGTGRGRYAADVALPGLKHVALVASHYPSARILSINTEAARAARGVHYVLTGEEFCAATDSLAIGVDAPKV